MACIWRDNRYIFFRHNQHYQCKRHSSHGRRNMPWYISNFSTSFGSTTLIGNGGYSGFAYIIASGTLSGATVTENLGSSDGVGLFVFAIDPAGAPPPPPPPPPHSLAPGTLYYVP